MSLDLTLLILNAPESLGDLRRALHPRQILRFYGDDEIFHQIDGPYMPVGDEPTIIYPRSVPGLRIESIAVMGNESVILTHDSRGGILTYSLAGELAAIVLPDGTHPINRAIMAYLREVPPDIPVVLYWE